MPLLERILLQALVSFLGDLGKIVHTFIIELKKQAADNPMLESVADEIISRIQEEHPDWTWNQKLAYASQTGLEYFAEIGKDVTRALWNSIIDIKIIDGRAPVDVKIARDAALND